MGQIFVRSHRKASGSVVRAYRRTSSAIKAVERRAYRGNKKTTNMTRQNQYYKVLSRLETKRETLRHALDAKLALGNALLTGGRRNIRSSRRYFSNNLSKLFNK